MSLKVNLRHLEDHDVHLEGQLTVSELDIDTKDEVIRLDQPLDYALAVQKLEGGLWCRAAATDTGLPMRPLPQAFLLAARARSGGRVTCRSRERTAVEVVNDCVDLTPYLREDILLELPQHPLCDPECRGLPRTGSGSPASQGSPGAGRSRRLIRLGGVEQAEVLTLKPWAVWAYPAVL